MSLWQRFETSLSLIFNCISPQWYLPTLCCKFCSISHRFGDVFDFLPKKSPIHILFLFRLKIRELPLDLDCWIVVAASHDPRVISCVIIFDVRQPQ